MEDAGNRIYKYKVFKLNTNNLLDGISFTILCVHMLNTVSSQQPRAGGRSSIAGGCLAPLGAPPGAPLAGSRLSAGWEVQVQVQASFTHIQ